MDACVVPSSHSTPGYMTTTSMHAGSTCNHLMTINAPMGNQYTVAASLAPASLPFWSPGRLKGLWMRKQFEDVFVAQAGPVAPAFNQTPDVIFTPSFNEFVIMPQNLSTALPMIANQYIQAMGANSSDPLRRTLLVDGYGAGRSRTLEPSTLDNGDYLNIYASCIRVSRLLAHPAVRQLFPAEDGPKSSSPAEDSSSLPTLLAAKRCPVSNESCCATRPDQDWLSVWSFQSPANADTPQQASATVITGNITLVAELRASSQWREICTPFQGQTDFCTNSTILGLATDMSAIRGPFLLWRTGAGAPDPIGGIPLYQCGGNLQTTSCSLDQSGEQLGYMGRGPTGTTPRALRRCQVGTSGLIFHTVGGPCVNATDTGILGFVL